MNTKKNSMPTPVLLSRFVSIGKWRMPQVKIATVLPETTDVLKAYLAANPDVDIDRGEDGRPRTAFTARATGFKTFDYTGTVDGLKDALPKMAQETLDDKQIKQLYSLTKTKLKLVGVFELPFNAGYQVTFQQFVEAKHAAQEPAKATDIDGAMFTVAIGAADKANKYKAFRLVSTLFFDSQNPPVKTAVLAAAESDEVKEAEEVKTSSETEESGEAENEKPLVFVTTEAAAIATAAARLAPKAKKFGLVQAPTVLYCKRQVNPVNGILKPIYRIGLDFGSIVTPLAIESIVDATSGQLVFAREKAHCAKPGEDSSKTAPPANKPAPAAATNFIPGLSILDVAIPNAKLEIREVQIDKSKLRKSGGKLFLANKNIELYYSETHPEGVPHWFPAIAIPDDVSPDGGTFKWKESSPQFLAVVLYHTLTRLIDRLEAIGLVFPKDIVIKVYADHPWNINNATFYWQYMIIQVGVGDGKFLRKHIALDTTVDMHEFSHFVVGFLRALEHFIPGPLGEALNEAIADMIATHMRFLNELEFGAQIGNALTYDSFMADLGGVGTYCVVEGGAFRWLANTLKYPQDRKPDKRVHDNAPIVGGAMFDMLKAWVAGEVQKYLTKDSGKKKDEKASSKDSGSQPKPLPESPTEEQKNSALAAVLPSVSDLMLKLQLLATAMLPANNVTFSDWRKALEDADKLLFKGAHLSYVAQGFDLHTIKINDIRLP